MHLDRDIVEMTKPDLKMSRRGTFALAMAMTVAMAVPATAVQAYESKWPKKPDVPTDFNAQEFVTELEQNGEYAATPAVKDAPTLFMVFDPQCPWCLWQMQQLQPLVDAKKINIRWHPVAVLSPWSDLQGGAILSAKDRYATFLKHESHFRDKNFKGLDVRKMKVPMKAQEAVWTNTKIYRRAGGRDVPFGVLALPNGKYVPIPQSTLTEFTKLSGISI